MFHQVKTERKEKMPRCCPCMGSGKCLRCTCVKVVRRCINCGLSKCNPARCVNQTMASQMASNVSTEGNQSSDTAVHNDSEFSSTMSNDMNLLQDARIKPERSEIEARAQ